jgi:tRNA threonylcarbamoyladenosine biosynthesis protein TsaE
MASTHDNAIMIDLADEAATCALGKRLALAAQPGDVFALEGPLGAGKSALARAFIRALTSDDEEVPSPTFTLAQSYDTAKGPVWHFDLFRLERPEDALELGIEDILPDAISLIEWPDRIGGALPRDRLTIRLSAGANETARRAEITAGPRWATRSEAIRG